MGDSRSLVEPLVPDEPQDADLDDAGNPDASRGHVFETRAAVSEGYRSDTFEEPPRRARHSLLSADYDYVPGETGLARAHYQRMRPPSPPSDRPWNQRVFSRISHRKQVRPGGFACQSNLPLTAHHGHRSAGSHRAQGPRLPLARRARR